MPREPKIINTAADILERDNGSIAVVSSETEPKKVVPFGDRTLILRDNPLETATPSSRILLPERAQAKQLKGTVLAISQKPGTKELPQHKVHDRVYFNDYGAFSVPESKVLVVVRNEDIVAAVEE